MKTAISISDASFERVKLHAARLGMSRSEFFVKAADKLADELDQEQVTEAINAALDQAGDDDNAVFLRRAATRTTESGLRREAATGSPEW